MLSQPIPTAGGAAAARRIILGPRQSSAASFGISRQSRPSDRGNIRTAARRTVLPGSENEAVHEQGLGGLFLLWSGLRLDLSLDLSLCPFVDRPAVTSAAWL